MRNVGKKADMAGLRKYCMGGYGRFGVYRRHKVDVDKNDMIFGTYLQMKYRDRPHMSSMNPTY